MAEPIAVIGLDAKLPCDGDTVEKFFQFLVDGRSARGPVPSDRYNAEAFWHPDHHRDGVIGGKEGHFLNANVKAFDAPFFAMTPAEAANLDPQQRMLLECVYTAMENAGYTMADMHNSLTGMYVGSFMWDFRDLLIKDVDVPMTYTATGTIASTLAGRVSWFYGLRGPALSVDTACSSSMVALHQAVVGLKSRDCNIAIACGTNVLLTPEMGLELNGLGVLDPAGASKSFDKSANGYGRGEGIAVVVLKRLSDAVRDGDTIRAVIRNSGCNHDGHSPGLTAPAKEAQAELMRMTYAKAQLDPSETRFFEAHGTGTNVGDPTEAAAISEMFTPYRSAEEPLIIGALKSNIGHTEGNSGVASFIKGVLCLEKGIIPANAWFEEKNPRIPDEWNLYFPTKAMPWPKTKSGVRRLSINSFGISGTNAHVVMDDALTCLKELNYVAPHRTVEVPRLPDPSSSQITPVINGTHFTPQLFVFSSQDQDGITRICNAYKEYLPTMTESLYNLSYTLATKRSRFHWRSAVVASSGKELEDILSKSQSATRAVAEPGLGLVFTGQGAQWARMGHGLMHYSPYRQSLESADAYLKTVGCEWSVIDELSKKAEDSRINDAEFSQTLCTAVQVALVDLLADWGVQFRAAAGHSSGEIAAAYSAGAISQESAWRIAYWRGKLSAKLARSPEQPKGTMAAVGLGLDKALEYIDRVNKSGFESVGKLAVACMNSKTSHTISGDVAQIDALVQLLNEESIFARKLKVEMAYHSKLMEPISKEYASLIGEIEPGSPIGQSSNVQFFSSAYGSHIQHSKLREAAYWTTNLTSPVRFNESMTAMLQALTGVEGEGSKSHLVTDIIEIGPHSALQGPLRNINDEVRGNAGVKYHHLLKRGEPDLQISMEGVGSLFTRGIELDLVKVNHVDGVQPSMMIDLPRYPFNHTREYWNECRLSRNFRFRPYPRHELLGAPVNDWDGQHDAIWRNWIRLSENPWVEHHTISGSVLYPAAGMLVMAIEGCKQLAERSCPEKKIKGIRFREVSFHSALQVPDDAMGVESHLYLRPVKQAALETKPSAWREFQVCTAQDDDQWREHCCGQVLIEFEEAASAVDGGLEDEAFMAHCKARIDDAQQKCKTRGTSDKIYQAWEDVGFVFGPTFQTVSDFAVDHESGVTLAKVKPTVPLLKTMMPKEYLRPHLIHPTTLDGALQACLVPLVSNPAKKQKSPIVISFMDELWVSASQHSEDEYLVFADSASHGRKKHLMSCTAVDSKSNEPMIKLSGCIVTEVDGSDDSTSVHDPRHRAWNIDYKPDPALLRTEKAEKIFEGAEGFHKYLDALAHKNPSMKFLDISNGTCTSAKKVLSTLGQRYVQYDLVDSSSSFLDEARTSISEEGNVQFKVVDIKAELASQDVELASYDVLIAPIRAIPNNDIDGVLRRILRLLKPEGKLLLTEARSKAMAKIWGTCLTRNGFAGVDAMLSNQGSLVLISSAPSQERSNGAATSGTYYVVGNISSDAQRLVAERLASCLAEKGVAANIATIEQYAQSTAGASQQEISESTCILLAELEAPLLASASEEVLAAVKTMVAGKRLLWVTKEETPEAALVNGFAATIRLERPELEFVAITFQSQEDTDTTADRIFEIDQSVSSNKGPYETSYKVIDGSITVPRLVEASAVTRHIKQIPNEAIAEVAFGADLSRPLRLQIQHVGLLSSLRFTDDHLYATPLEEFEVEFQTMATAVNFKDLAVMLGKIQETPVGLEAAGIVTRVGAGVTRFKPGDRVFGFTFNGAFSTYGRGAEGTLAKVPENQSFAEAAVIPIVYTTAYACLYDIGGLDKRTRRGQKSTVLIHAAAGGVGQAAIQLAQCEGAEIFATVGSLEKRDFLEKTYGLPRDHIFSSRDLTFKEGVLRMTGGRGVDIVINSLSGDTLRATWEIVAPFGSFAEIGLSDIESRSRISMGTFARGVRFESLELNYMRQTDSGRLDDLFARAMESVIGLGIDRKTPITRYPVSKIQDAMRFMQSGKHIGKILVECNHDDVVQVVERSLPTTKFTSDATYVVSGGFGGLGIEIIRWMAQQGARNMIVTSRKGPVDESAKALIAELQSNGVNIVTPCCDITDKKALEEAIVLALSNMPPVRGCIQASTVLRDNVFTSMTADEWHGAVNVKVAGSKNLWEVLTSDSTLDFFVMLSSLTAVTGNTGQSNYSAGNAYQDAMAKHLASQGHNVVALNAPVMSDAGMVAVRPMLREYLLSIGWAYMSVGELLNALDYYCRPTKPGQGKEISTKDAQVIPMLWLPKYSADEGAEQPTWQHEPMYNHLVLHSDHGGNSLPGKHSSGKRSTADLIAASESLKQAEQIVLDALLAQLSKILSYELVDLDPSRPLNVYGVDSLVAVELRVWMTKEIGADLSVFELTSGQRIAQLAGKAAASSRFLPNLKEE
ncbi:mycocerosic acid synthase [Colletotrichum navitas]|uniref:Mycocerosic acid synthase n=1 Tax=Colletotrichum navitas TaxID=681940 RepID=A0AAD8PQ38_9PEZI|nr:mycocerosic acid synthase [Colletotrichum navitas]KAK1573694.1 mycocerosic acid synthase [Colletotrichum navitas]